MPRFAPAAVAANKSLKPTPLRPSVEPAGCSGIIGLGKSVQRRGLAQVLALAGEFVEDHLSAIRQYAEAYERLECLQRADNALLPIGDQKTGVIAEFFARIYAQTQFPMSELIFGTPSEHVWDIKVRTAGQPDHLIQVKCVSAHSRTSRVSQIHPGWHELYLLRLDTQFWPVGFWTLRATEVAWSTNKLACSTMPKRGAASSGSAVFASAHDRLESMLAAIAARRANNSSKPTPLRGAA